MSEIIDDNEDEFEDYYNDMTDSDEFIKRVRSMSIEEFDAYIESMSNNPFDWILESYIDEYLDFLCQNNMTSEAEYHGQMHSIKDKVSSTYIGWSHKLAKDILEYLKGVTEEDRSEDIGYVEEIIKEAEDEFLAPTNP